jgi:hypothetical protein
MVEWQDLEMTPIGWHTQLGRFMMGPTTASQLKLVEAIDIRMQSDRINTLPPVCRAYVLSNQIRVGSRET